MTQKIEFKAPSLRQGDWSGFWFG